MKTFLTLASSLAVVFAATKHDYTTNGADWPDKSPGCKATNQSPIDLKNDAPQISFSKEDNFHLF